MVASQNQGPPPNALWYTLDPQAHNDEYYKLVSPEGTYAYSDDEGPWDEYELLRPVG